LIFQSSSLPQNEILDILLEKTYRNADRRCYIYFVHTVNFHDQTVCTYLEKNGGVSTGRQN